MIIKTFIFRVVFIVFLSATKSGTARPTLKRQDRTEEAEQLRLPRRLLRSLLAMTVFRWGNGHPTFFEYRQKFRHCQSKSNRIGESALGGLRKTGGFTFVGNQL